MVLYMAVSRDKYELPVAVAESVNELARMLGINEGTIYNHISLVGKNRIRKQKYFRIEVEEESD